MHWHMSHSSGEIRCLKKSCRIEHKSERKRDRQLLLAEESLEDRGDPNYVYVGKIRYSELKNIKNVRRKK